MRRMAELGSRTEDARVKPKADSCGLLLSVKLFKSVLLGKKIIPQAGMDKGTHCHRRAT